MGIPWHTLKTSLSPAAKHLRKAGNTLKRRREQGPYNGRVDGIISNGSLAGWAVRRKAKDSHVTVGLFAGDKILAVTESTLTRDDVSSAIGCHSQCGFQFELTPSLVDRILQADDSLTVRPIGDEKFIIGHPNLTVGSRRTAETNETQLETFRLALEDEFEMLLDLLDDNPETGCTILPRIKTPPLKPHQAFFTLDPLIPEIKVSGQPAFLDYTRFRMRLEERYQVEPDHEAADRYLYWYITNYRLDHRTPLSRKQLEYLNSPLVMAGQTHVLSRIMWWRLEQRPDMMAHCNLNDIDSFLNILFWWAIHDSVHIYKEDCLVPERYAEHLRRVRHSRLFDAYPLSYFTERYLLEDNRLHFLQHNTPEGRKGLILALLLISLRRPDYLRYIPRKLIEELLAPNESNPGGMSDFESFLNGILEVVKSEHKLSRRLNNQKAKPNRSRKLPEHITLPRNRYAALLRKRFFDLDSYSFLTLDRNGNRIESAALPLPDPSREKVDIQLVGPLAKTSGLGQATRLSADILRETGLKVRAVNFDLDNPSPEGFSSDTMVENYGPAKVNLLHLNADTIPLAFAYQPDVFSGAYNIGYFFWELTKPAYCHYLSFKLLDEIWVSTDYGVQIYRKEAGRTPVTNVGMCYEETPNITREASREFVERCFRFNASHFVCLVAFDSFSFIQRKNPLGVLFAFQKAFKDVPEARLVIKTQNRHNVFDPVQIEIWDRIETIIASDSRIVLQNETLSYNDLLKLKAGSDLYISLHKSEGWGFGMVEAMNLGVPVVATAYSGNMDYCTDEFVWLVDYEIEEPKQEDYIFVRPGAEWALPNIDDAARQLRAAFNDPVARQKKAKAAFSHVQKNFSRKAIAKHYGHRLRKILKDLN